MNKKTAFYEKETTHIVEDAEGNLTEHTTKESHMIRRSAEPDYIKIYTQMWCEFNGIPETYRATFMQLALRMSYCNSQDLDTSQIVYTSGPNKKAIMRAVGINCDQVFYRHLKALSECNAIKQIARGCYQINPQYAGRGAWRYNAKEAQGGIEDLIAVFRFKDGTVDSQFTWAAGDDHPNAQELGLNEGDQIVARSLTHKKEKSTNGQ